MSVPHPPACASVETKVLNSLFRCQPCPADDWEYPVGNDWIARVKELLSDPEQPLHIPPLSSSFNNDGNIFLKESVWKILVSWYGLAEEYYLCRRYAVSMYTFVAGKGDRYLLSSKELDFIHVSMCYLDSMDCPDKQYFQQVFMWETYNFLELHMKRILGIDNRKSIRLWVSVNKDSQSVFLGVIGSAERDQYKSIGSLLFSKVPALAKELEKRQAFSADAKCHLALLLSELGLSVFLCAEDLGDLGCSGQHIEPSITGITPHLLVSKAGPDWSRALEETLDEFEAEVNISVKTKREKLAQDTKRLVKVQLEDIKNRESQLGVLEKNLEEREKRFSEHEKELNEREHELNIKVDKFKRGLTDYLLQKKRLEEELKRIEKQNQFADSRVELNVGGVKYVTSTLTLTKEPDSLLALMFSGRHHVQKEVDGSYFVDRDGTNFRHILNYLRDGDCAMDALAGQSTLLKELLRESDYFQLSQMSDLIRSKLGLMSAGPFSSMPQCRSPSKNF